MRYLDEYRRPEPVRACIREIAEALGDRSATLMEVCGTHTVAIFRSGLRNVFPDRLELLSGPGCPVCVTPNAYMDRAVAYCRRPDTIVATFGDMFRVPGSSSSLEKERACGADVRTVYSAMDSLEIAAQNPGKKVVFLGVGFETTTPSVAATVLAAVERDIKNYYLYCGHKLVPPALRALARDKDIAVQGLILPGHVSTVIGSEPYGFLCSEFRMPSVITGFEPLDIAQGVRLLVEQIAQGTARLEIQYKRSVRPEGNPKARRVMDRVFKPCDCVWRGIGNIPGSGLEIAPEFAGLDARANIEAEVEEERVDTGCICGEVLRGVKKPVDCPLFGSACTPVEPVGACMVSSEGTCAAYHKYGREG
ncbi:MAG: hydrogenase formation protein HypD [Elusimicrobiota bacterium]